MSNALYNDLLYDSAQAKSRSVGALFGFAEYLSNAINKAREFLRDDVVGTLYTTITKQIDDTKGVVLTLSNTQYQNAINALDETTILLDSAGNEHELDNEEIADLYQDAISEICVQKEYVGCCLTGVNFSASDLVTRVKGLYPGVTGQILEKYTNLVDNSSLLSSLENLFQFGNLTTTQEEDGVLVIKSTVGYTGVNIWEVALKQIGDTIASFFVNVVWKGITKIGEFLSSIWDAIKKLGIWLVGKLAHQYMTNYTKTSSSTGIMDYPIMQFYFGKVYPEAPTGSNFLWSIDVDRDSTNWFEICKAVENEILSAKSIDLTSYGSMYMFKGSCRDYATVPQTDYLPGPTGAQSGGKLTRIMSIIYQYVGILVEHGLRYTDEDGNAHMRTLDVTVPVGALNDQYYSTRGMSWNTGLDSQDVLLRFGVDQNNNLFMQVYVIDTYENQSQYTDVVNAERIRRSISTMQRALLLLNNGIVGDIASYPDLNDNVSLILTNSRGPWDELVLNTSILPSSDGPYDLVSDLKLLDAFNYCNDHKTSSGWIYSSTEKHGHLFDRVLSLMLSSLQYACTNSNITDDWGKMNESDNLCHGKIFSTSSQWEYNSQTNGLYWQARGMYTRTCGYSDRTTTPGTVYIPNFDYTNHWEYFHSVAYNFFLPYSINRLIPVSIHYQNIDERASEISKGIWTILAMVAVAIVAYKTIKFIKNRKNSTFLAKAAMDKFSWDMAADASPENVAKYNAARKKYKKMNMMNHLLGLSASSAAEATFASSDAVVSAIKGLKSDENGFEDNAITLTYLKTLISGQ